MMTLRLTGLVALALIFQGCDGGETTAAAPRNSSVESSPVPQKLPALEPNDEVMVGEPTDVYYRGYLAVQKAEKTADANEARRWFQEALNHFTKVKSQFPDWKTKMVDARIERTQHSLARLSKKTH